MEIKDKVQYAKVLEDRLNNIEDSYGNSVIESPINILQSRLINDVEEIGLDYLLNYQTIRLGNAINMSIYASEFYPIINSTEQYKEEADGIKICPTDNKSDISRILNERRSIRKYSGEAISFDTISNIFINTQNTHNIDNFVFRNTSYGGGLYPVDLYLYVNKIETLERGIYLYQPIKKQLKLVKKDCKDAVSYALLNQTVLDIEKCGGIIFFSYDYTKNFQKYGDLALALGLIEVGIIAQTIHINSSFYGIGSCDIGGFDKPACEKFLGLDGINKHAVYAVILGRKE